MSKKQNASLKTAADLQDSMDMLGKVWMLREAGLSFSAIEDELNLRRANGMTAYRMIQRCKKVKRSK